MVISALRWYFQGLESTAPFTLPAGESSSEIVAHSILIDTFLLTNVTVMNTIQVQITFHEFKYCPSMNHNGDLRCRGRLEHAVWLCI